MDFELLKTSAKQEFESIKNSAELEAWRVKYLGRKAELALFLRSLAHMTLSERRVLGPKANQIRKELETLYQKQSLVVSGKLSVTAVLDITQPGTKYDIGHLHPVTQVKNELNDAFKFLGFGIYEGPEISSEGYDFDNLNFPNDHPARESMDTYWIKPESVGKSAGAKKGFEKLCLRPHLTGISVRYMQTHKPPFRFVYPGRTFRSEATDAGHERTFYQYEALMVDKDISLAGGKILVSTILERVFGRQVAIRMRPGFFPFVEPGFEIDMQCLNCAGTGCSVCGGGWVEIMPGGMPHPNVLRAGGINPNQWQGFYINIGLDRIAMMKYGIDDIRLLHSGDLRFLRQF